MAAKLSRAVGLMFMMDETNDARIADGLLLESAEKDRKKKGDGMIGHNGLKVPSEIVEPLKNTKKKGCA